VVGADRLIKKRAQSIEWSLDAITLAAVSALRLDLVRRLKEMRLDV